jgi:hypothetical protein
MHSQNKQSKVSQKKALKKNRAEKETQARVKKMKPPLLELSCSTVRIRQQSRMVGRAGSAEFCHPGKPKEKK